MLVEKNIVPRSRIFLVCPSCRSGRAPARWSDRPHRFLRETYSTLRMNCRPNYVLDLGFACRHHATSPGVFGHYQDLDISSLDPIPAMLFLAWLTGFIVEKLVHNDARILKPYTTSTALKVPVLRLLLGRNRCVFEVQWHFTPPAKIRVPGRDGCRHTSMNL